MATGPSRIPISVATLFKIAGGTFIAGSTALYLLQKHTQRRVRQFPHYTETFKIISNHKELKLELGEPIQVGQLDLSDRRRNYVDKLESKLRIPISGPLNGGYVNVLATRSDETEDFKPKRLEFESAAGSILFYEA
ncbi:hypothetical protein M3Y95_00642900 [Aphelenchoides besseyi]|nr:hypothetical protein M3Y95_00642900 [Aphelenchoides besseyi]